MNAEEYNQFLLNNIKPFAHRVSGGREINCRCFYCSDSKNIRKGHFYISCLSESNNAPSLYNCVKCHACGIVTHSKLLEWGLFDANISVQLLQYNAKVLQLSENRKYKDTEVYNISNTKVSKDILSEYKLKYINNRLGISLNYNDCLDNKIILNLKDLLAENNLTPTRHANIIEQLDSNFLGFLSYDNAFINMRNLDIPTSNLYEGINKRYINYNIFEKFDNTNKFYVIPTEINTMYPIKLHIAEGPFDVLSIKYNMRKEIFNNIYTAIEGSGYFGIIRKFITQIKLINMEIHVYADSDIDFDTIHSIAQFVSVFNMPFYLHRNSFKGEKDFGVPTSRISETIQQIV